LNAATLRDQPDQSDEFEVCRDFDRGVPILMAYAPGLRTHATLLWRRFDRQLIRLGKDLEVDVEIMGGETSQGVPEHLRRTMEARAAVRQELLQQDDASNTAKDKASNSLTIEPSFLSACSRVANQEAERQINKPLQFLFDIYRTRYGFTDQQINAFDGEASFAMRTSIYITLRKHPSREILGTIRLVRAPYGRRYAFSKATGAIVSDHSGNFGPTVEKLLPFEIEPRGQGPGSELEFPEADRYRYQKDIRMPPMTLGPDIRFYEFTNRNKPIGGGEFRPLPLEMALRVKLPRDALGPASVNESSDSESVHYSSGELIEIGTFAIAKSAPPEVKFEIFRQLVKVIERLSQNQHVVLWNRTKYPVLFKGLGFQIVGRPFESRNVKQSVMRAESGSFIKRVSELVASASSGAASSKGPVNDDDPFANQIRDIEKDVASSQTEPATR
jgi:hypothetical protein